MDFKRLAMGREEIGRAHGEAFGAAGPALSLVHVKPFLDPDMLVDVELVAFAGRASARSVNRLYRLP